MQKNPEMPVSLIKKRSLPAVLHFSCDHIRGGKTVAGAVAAGFGGDTVEESSFHAGNFDGAGKSIDLNFRTDRFFIDDHVAHTFILLIPLFFGEKIVGHRDPVECGRIDIQSGDTINNIHTAAVIMSVQTQDDLTRRPLRFADDLFKFFFALYPGVIGGVCDSGMACQDTGIR